MKKYYAYVLVFLLPLIGVAQSAPTDYLLLDGTQSINVPDTKYINFEPHSSRTVEFWFKVDDVNAAAKQMIYKEGGGLRGINFYVEAGKLYLGIYNKRAEYGSAIWYGTWFRKTVVSNQWYHVALVLDNGDSNVYGTELSWYLDGTFQNHANGGTLYKHGNDIYLGSNVQDSTYPSNAALWVTNNGSEIYEAAADSDSPKLVGDFYLSGAVGNLRIWNSARSASEINNNKNTVYVTSDLNVAPENLVAFLNDDQIEYVDSGDANTITADSNTGTAYNSTYFVWDGYTDGDWTNPENWDPYNTMPSAGDNVSIETGKNGGNSVDPIFTAGTAYNYNIIVVSSASTIALQNGVAFSASNSLTNNGTLSLQNGSTLTSTFVKNNSGSTLALSGTNLITGDLTTLSGSTVSITNGADITITGSYSNGTNFTLGDISKLTIENDLVNNSGVTFEVKSSASGTGSLLAKGNVTNSGTFKIERYIDPGSKWQLVSSPLDNETANSFYGHFLNSYDEDQGDFNSITDETTLLVKGEGYVSKRDASIAGYAPNPIVFNVGKPVSGDLPFDLIPNTWTSGGDANTYFNLPDGFNLIGNPYTSSLDWDAIYAANSGVVNSAYYRYHDDGSNGGKGAWVAYTSGTAGDDNRYINMGQGFGVVLSTNAANTITFPNSARTNNQGNSFSKKQNISNHSFVFNASSNGSTDNIRFKQNERATNNFDVQFDAYKFNPFGSMPTPYFVSADNKRLSICEMPESESVDLGFNMAVSGEVTFSLSNVQDFVDIVLEDKDENTFTDLMKNDYTFNYNTEDAETGRFILHFNRETLSEVEELMGMNIYSNQKDVHITSNEELKNVEVSIYSITGELVYSKNFQTLTNEVINTNLSGVNILKLTSDKGEITSKLVLK